jgi:chromosome segregation ATPase
VRSEKPDKNIIDIYEHISRLGDRIVALDDRLARWDKKMTKLEKQQEDKSEKRKAAELRMTEFDQSIDKAVSSILASVAPTVSKSLLKIGEIESSPHKFQRKEKIIPLHPISSKLSGKLDSDSDSLSEAETVAGEVTAGGVEIPADSESQWILVTRKKKHGLT